MMKNKRLFKKIVIEAAALLVFAALCLSSVLYALGYFELPYIDRNKTVNPYKMPDLTAAEDSIKATDTGENISGIGSEVQSTPGSGQPDPHRPAPPEAAAMEISPAADLSAQGYRVTYDTWNGEKMKLGLVYGSSALPAAENLGNTKVITEVEEVRYEEGGAQFAFPVSKTVTRQAVELYMGYILVDTGAGNCTLILRAEDGNGVRQERATVYSKNTLTVRDSLGKLIGVYPAEDVVPAYTRDRADHPLFLYNESYYYIDNQTGDFLLSDYVDERDNRGLYYDYDPSFGKSDNNIQKWGEETDVLLHYEVDTYLIYARYGVDWRIARELYMQNQKYAELVASTYGRNKYYNAAFAGVLALEKQKLKQEGWKPTTTTKSPITTLSPATTVSPETTAEPLTTIAPEMTDPSGPADSSGNMPEPDAAATPSEVSASAILSPSPLFAETPVGSSAGSSATGSSGVDSSAVDSSSVASSAVDSTAVETTAVTTEPPATVPVTTEPEHTIEVVDKVLDTYRFIYAAAHPAVNSGAVQTTTRSISSYIYEKFSWNSQYKYAKAFNYSEGRAVTLDDNGVLRILNTAGGTSVRLDRQYYNRDIETYVHEYYTEPFFKDLRSAGHYYYDNGLIRVRRIETINYMPYYYNQDDDYLLDVNGNRYNPPAGYNLVSYADGILILERNGLYGCYHKDGYWVAQPIYTAAEPFVEGLCVLTLSDGTKGMIDTQGNVILAFRYTQITNASTGVISCYSPTEGWTVLAKMEK